MASEGFEGTKFELMFDKLAPKLFGYAWPILLGWTASGQIFRECQKYRRPVAQRDAASRWTSEDRQQIVTATCVAGVDYFREYALKRWNGHRDACLTTFFVGACASRFPEKYEQWRKKQQVTESVRLAARGYDDTDDAPPERLLPSQPDPALVAIARDEARRAMRQVHDPELREVLWLRALGYPQAEAAEKVGITEKAAEGRLGRHRKNLRGAESANPVDPGEGEQGAL